jgi:hypothetical protein
VFADQDVEDHAVDLVVYPVVGEDADRVFGLAVALDTALALFVAGGVPGEVVVEDGVEVLLEVYSLGEGSG